MPVCTGARIAKRPLVHTAGGIVDDTAELIVSSLDHSPAYTYPFRFALALGQRASFREVALDSPALDIGVNDGSTARIVHHGKPRLSWGGDMPEESTTESRGLFVSPDYNVYDDLIGMDACEIPFPDNSFATVVSTEVFFYGMDRTRLLSEIVRVLAPGGTLAFSESSPAIWNYPRLVRRLKEEIPAFNVPADPRTFYRECLTSLGMREFFFRPYFDASVAALTLSTMYAWPPDASRQEYAQLIRSDAHYRSVHRDGLAAIASLMRREFEVDAGPASGWNVFVSCRKPGTLSASLPVPQPRCLFCGHERIDRTFERCVCTACGHVYQTRFGRSYLLRDPSTAYCPKPAERYAADWAERLEQRIASALDALSRNAPALLGPAKRVVLVGVDSSSEFTLAHLQRYGAGIHVDAVASLEQRSVGYEIGGTPIVSLDDLAGVGTPLLLSGLGSKQHAALAQRLRAAGHTGTILSIADRRIDVLPLKAAA